MAWCLHCSCCPDCVSAVLATAAQVPASSHRTWQTKAYLVLLLLPQVEFADVVLLNKCDLATAAQLQQVPVAYIAVCSRSAAYDMFLPSVHALMTPKTFQRQQGSRGRSFISGAGAYFTVGLALMCNNCAADRGRRPAPEPRGAAAAVQALQGGPVRRAGHRRL
jgi:hypothetical protein